MVISVSGSPRGPAVGDQRLLMYRMSKHRSRSSGPALKEKRKVEFGDSRMVAVCAKAGADCGLPVGDVALMRLESRSNEMSRQHFENKGFARLDMKHHPGISHPVLVTEMHGSTVHGRTFYDLLDKWRAKTLQNIGWVSGANEDQTPVCPTSDKEAEELYKLTKVEFRKLQEQVQDVSANLKNRFRSSAYQPPQYEVQSSSKKLYQRPSGESNNQVYRTQLAASLKAFQQKQWPALNHQELDPTFFRCRPVNNHTHDRPSTSCSVRGVGASGIQRPKSVPPSTLRARSAQYRQCDTPLDVRPGKFDTLSPQVISELMGRADRPGSDYEGSPATHSPLTGVIAEENKRLLDNDDASTTSGIDSGASDQISPSSDEDSDFEPDIDPDIDIPKLNLRPEKLDAIYIPESKRGWRQYDFDMANIDMPPYEFKNPFPEFVEEVDLKQMAKLNWNWRNHLKTKTGPRDSDLEGILDRLVEFEKLQLDTVDWENKRAKQLKRAVPKRNLSAKLKDKRCDPGCLQTTCFGDCPEKLVQSNTCDHCRQALCTGTCKDIKYEQRMRQPRVDEERPVTPKLPFPRACTSCQKRHNAKFINANNLILGAQRFNNSTYSRGQNALKTRDLRPRGNTSLPKDVLQEFEKLNVDPVQTVRPSTSMALARPRSRNGMLPGKSFNSQRKNSLTDLDKIGQTTKKVKKVKTRTKRPKTAG